MSAPTFFFVGMLLIWAVVSGKATAIWNAIVGQTNSAPVQSVPTP